MAPQHGTIPELDADATWADGPPSGMAEQEDPSETEAQDVMNVLGVLNSSTRMGCLVETAYLAERREIEALDGSGALRLIENAPVLDTYLYKTRISPQVTEPPAIKDGTPDPTATDSTPVVCGTHLGTPQYSLKEEWDRSRRRAILLERLLAFGFLVALFVAWSFATVRINFPG